MPPEMMRPVIAESTAIPPKVKQKRQKHAGGRPRKDDAQKARQGTLRPSRVRRESTPKAAAVSVPSRPYLAIAASYAAGVADGTITACKWVKLAIERQARELARYRTPESPYVWSDMHAIDACTFCEQCPHTEGRWATPTITLAPWQVWLVTTLYGWRHRADPARRRFTVLYLELGRKGAKSTLMAALLLYHLVRENEPGAQGICGATTGAQARIVFTIAQRMVRTSLWLRLQGLQAFAHAITTADGNIKPINAKASTQDGLNPSAIVLDESHAQTFELHDVLKSAQGARHNPLLACPTTAGYNVLSVGYALRTTSTKVLEGVIDTDHLLALIYTIDDGDDWRDERVWEKSMPMIGVTPSRDFVRAYCQDAQQTPQLEAEFRVKMCSEWLNSASTWLSIAAWDRCADPALRIEDFAGAPCWMGADLSQRDDMSAVAAVFERGGVLYAFVRLYLPEDVVLERARAVPEYRVWKDAGILTLTPGNMIDYNTIERDIRAWAKRFHVRDICFDPWGSSQMVSALATDGLPARDEKKNGRTMTGPARELEARVKHGRFRHDGNTAFRWHASNVVVRQRSDGSLVTEKDHQDSPNKIDAIDALLNALNGWLRQGPAPPPYAMVMLG